MAIDGMTTLEMDYFMPLHGMMFETSASMELTKEHTKHCETCQCMYPKADRSPITSRRSTSMTYRVPSTPKAKKNALAKAESMENWANECYISRENDQELLESKPLTPSTVLDSQVDYRAYQEAKITQYAWAEHKLDHGKDDDLLSSSQNYDSTYDVFANSSVSSHLQLNEVTSAECSPNLDFNGFDPFQSYFQFGQAKADRKPHYGSSFDFYNSVGIPDYVCDSNQGTTEGERWQNIPRSDYWLEEHLSSDQRSKDPKPEDSELGVPSTSHCASEKAVHGRWSLEEDVALQRLVKAQYAASGVPIGTQITDYRKINWVDIVLQLPRPRTITQARVRYLEALDETINRGSWSKAEDNLLMKAYSVHGNKWVQVAKMVGSRTQRQCRTRAQVHVRHQAAMESLRPSS